MFLRDPLVQVLALKVSKLASEDPLVQVLALKVSKLASEESGIALRRLALEADAS
jgi:hypothetical protein